MNREAIYVAFWNLILAAPFASDFSDMQRLWRPIDDVSAAQMPAVYLFQQGESWVRTGKGIPAKRTLNSSLVFYVSTPSGCGVLPATLMNGIMDNLDTLFNPGVGQVQTLGGLVEHVYMAEGEVRFYEGLLQEKSPVTIPVRILVP